MISLPTAIVGVVILVLILLVVFVYVCLSLEVQKYVNAIRRHRDQHGDDRCWMDDEVLYEVLPEGYTPPERDTCVELEKCQQYIGSRHNPRTVYVSPEREIERLNAANSKLRWENFELAKIVQEHLMTIRQLQEHLAEITREDNE